jgi:hypothetical protein
MPRPLASGLPLSQSELSEQKIAWEKLVTKWVGSFSGAQQPQVSALICSWCLDVSSRFTAESMICGNVPRLSQTDTKALRGGPTRAANRIY